MKNTCFFFISVVVFVLHSAAFAHVKFSDAERTIIRLQDERRGTDTIAHFLDAEDEKVAWRAAIALANIADTNSRLPLIKRLSKEIRPQVIEGIAFALGVLGPNKNSYEALMKVIVREPSDELFIGLARTMPKENAGSLSSVLSDSKLPPHYIASALVEIGLRKLMNEDFAKKVDDLGKNDNPDIRWRAIYSFARTEDSSLLYHHIGTIKESLQDVGSPESRMFAATALGRIHNEEAGKMLIDAARSETEWRVKVNIFNAIGKLPHFTSAIHDIIKKAVTESVKDSAISNHLAGTALDVLDQMIVSGKVSSPDSIGIGEWLMEYDPDQELHEDQSMQIRSQCMIPLARLRTTDQKIKIIRSYLYLSDKNAFINASKAMGLLPDTLAFLPLFRKAMEGSSPSDVPYAIDGLHSYFETVRKDTNLYRKLEKNHLGNVYRHLLIRFPSITDDPAVVTRTLEYIKDPFVITDTVRKEAEEYLLQYLDKFAYPKYHDQMISVLSAVAWLKPKNDTFGIKIETLINNASLEWGDQMIIDTAEAALAALGKKHKHQFVQLIRQPIDWNMIEHMPDTMIIQSTFDMIYIKLNTYETPLSALNMIKLAKINWFANNYIHRIVPNFVIQSGDITGSGDGGPDYRIRTEIAPIRYDSAGVVGMASSGKDTEGSQWFITECPTPHLNTRYTIWGEVVIGKENVEKFQLNDKIENMISYR